MREVTRKRPQIVVQYPVEREVTAHGQTFFLGRVDPPTSALAVNGRKVGVHSRGGFLVTVPVSPGINQFEFEATHGRAAGSLTVALDIRCLRLHRADDIPRVDVSSLLPSSACSIAAGEELWVSFSGTPGCRGSCGYEGCDDRAALRETQRSTGVSAYVGAEEPLGLYLGRAPAPPPGGSTLVVELTSEAGKSVAERGPTIRAVGEERWARASHLTPLRASPWGPPDWWLPPDCPVKVRASMGEHLLAQRGESRLGWGRGLEPCDQPRTFSAVLEKLELRDEGDHVEIRSRCSSPLPYQLNLTADRTRAQARFAGALPPRGRAVSRVVARSTDGGGVVELSVDLADNRGWGYRGSWFDGQFRLQIRRSPESSELQDKLVCLDAGHGPQPGAIGPTGIREQSANLALAVALEQELTRRGARVLLTRRGRRGPTLSERVKLAEGAWADVLLSLHHNAVPDGVDPYLNMGTSVYYFHERCRPLAMHLQKTLVAELRLGDLGARWGDLVLCRGTFMPSVLVEPAFLISPDHEALVITRDYRRRCSQAIADGLEAYLKEAIK